MAEEMNPNDSQETKEKELTKEDANEIANFIDKDTLTDCTDGEWLVIEEAIKEWKSKENNK